MNQVTLFVRKWNGGPLFNLKNNLVVQNHGTFYYCMQTELKGLPDMEIVSGTFLEKDITDLLKQYLPDVLLKEGQTLIIPAVLVKDEQPKKNKSNITLDLDFTKIKINNPMTREEQMKAWTFPEDHPFRQGLDKIAKERTEWRSQTNRTWGQFLIEKGLNKCNYSLGNSKMDENKALNIVSYFEGKLKDLKENQIIEDVDDYKQSKQLSNSELLEVLSARIVSEIMVCEGVYPDIISFLNQKEHTDPVKRLFLLRSLATDVEKERKKLIKDYQDNTIDAVPKKLRLTGIGS